MNTALPLMRRSMIALLSAAVLAPLAACAQVAAVAPAKKPAVVVVAT